MTRKRTPRSEHARRTRRKHSTALAVVVALAVSVLLVEAGLVITTIVSPTATKALSAKVGELQNAWNGSDGNPGLPSRVLSGLDRFYQEEVVSLLVRPEPDQVAPTFTTCSGCHPGYETKTRFTHVYLSHQTHGQAGIACAKCHTMVAHPNPDRPAESVCQECHDQVTGKGKCDFCHPPGTLPHFYLMGAPRDRYIECATCHPQTTIPTAETSLVNVGDFSGNPDTLCRECHTVKGVSGSTAASPSPGATASPSPSPSDTTGAKPIWCQRCHVPPTTHPDDWYTAHREQAISQPNWCIGCHDPTWCAMKCHAVTSLGSPPLLPLPSPVSLPGLPQALASPSPTPTPTPTPRTGP